MHTIKKYLNWKGWLAGLYKNVVKASTSAVLALAGTNAAEAAGLAGVGMNWKQAGAAAVSVAIIEALRYVNTQPAPETVVETSDTTVTEKP